MADEDESEKQYAWEQTYKRTWDTLHEGAGGALVNVHLSDQRAKKQRLNSSANVAQTIRRGMIRFTVLVVDLSSTLHQTDLKPSRLVAVLNTATAFIKEYFDQNPISQLSIVITRNSVAERITELSGNPKHQIQKLKEFLRTGGEASLYNSLEVARRSLSMIPPYGNREILCIWSSLHTTDPENIMDAIQDVKKDNIRCSVIGLSAEVHICKHLATSTGGSFNVCLDEEHFKDLLLRHASPPPSQTRAPSSLIQMGFPNKKAFPCPMICVCHSDFRVGGYFCPRCRSKLCELPTECRVCGLTLISSPHLARSFHHLFPLAAFHEINETANANHVVANNANSADSVPCYACLQTIDIKCSLCVECPRCLQKFCFDCDSFIHESLHNCPGCENGLFRLQSA